MNNGWIIIGVAVLVFLAIIVLIGVLRAAHGRTLKGGARIRIQNAWQHVHTIADPVRKVLEADKVLDLALTELGYTGSLGEKLKKAGPRFSDINGVWNAHKLRNKLAHETGVGVSEGEMRRALAVFERAIRDVL